MSAFSNPCDVFKLLEDLLIGVGVSSSVCVIEFMGEKIPVANDASGYEAAGAGDNGMDSFSHGASVLMGVSAQKMEYYDISWPHGKAPNLSRWMNPFWR